VLRQTLRFVQQDHRIHQVVQLATGRRPVGKQRLQQLDVGGQYDWRIPVLGQETSLPVLVSFGIAARRFCAQTGETVVL